ncbi:MAG: DNA polymerase III subunit chi [Burkholderiaceae bacterium]
MTRIDFHFNAPDKAGYACRLLRKIYRAGLRCQVVSDDAAALGHLDELLWTFSRRDFIPHVSAADPLAGATPIVLTTGAADTDHLDVLVNLGSTTPPHFSRFERLIEIVTVDEDDRRAARERWRQYRDRGHPMTRHDLATR